MFILLLAIAMAVFVFVHQEAEAVCCPHIFPPSCKTAYLMTNLNLEAIKQHKTTKKIILQNRSSY
jgi:hypothetical protein